ncbi:hypothetical protein OS493_036608 [Desmophyllum pertusum]|uniref:Uncharacterized protein n=1 Tax=Desmophyllum pertusum TaxID=174260 RepID=A0A9W9ZIR3_9CNID|nr:hypothetical protein OS493_036608 [Desmophyllum pertusum]
MEEGQRELHFTYLDTVGRPVVVASKSNLVVTAHTGLRATLLLQQGVYCYKSHCLLSVHSTCFHACYHLHEAGLCYQQG